MFVLLGVFGCVTSLGAMLLGMSDLTGISPRINLRIKFLFEENLQHTFGMEIANDAIKKKASYLQ